MRLSARLLGRHYTFASIPDAMGRANEQKSGDEQAGVAARDPRERVAAKIVVADLTLQDLHDAPSVPPEHDEISRTVLELLDPRAETNIGLRGCAITENARPSASNLAPPLD